MEGVTISFWEALILINHIFIHPIVIRRFVSSSFAPDASLRLDGSMQISLLPAASLAPEYSAYSGNTKFCRPRSAFALMVSIMWKLRSELLF